MTQYIAAPIVVDPEELFDQFKARMQEQFPGWEPADANIDTWIGESVAGQQTVVAEAAAEVTTSIFRYWAARLVGVTPIDATAATGLTAWTLTDTDGHTIPAGTQLVKDAGGDTTVLFETSADTVVAPGSSTATNVAIVAAEEGEAGNDLTGSVDLVDLLAYVDSVTITDTTSGGVEAEEDDDYLDRAVAELQLLTPRPILPEDFAVMARRVAGVHRAVAIDGFDATDNEQQTITGTATGGTGTLTWDGQTTASMPRNETAANIKTALEALSNIEPGDINVTGGPLGTAPVVVEFVGRYRNTNVAQIVPNTGSLTGGTWTVATTRTVTSVYDPANTATWAERTVTVVGLDEDGAGIGSAVKTAVDALLQAEREVNFVVHVIDPSLTTIDVTFTATAWPDWDLTEVEDAAEAAVADFLDPARWGLPEDQDDTEWELETKVRASEVYHVLEAVPGLRHVDSLTLLGGTASGSDRLLAGPAPLPVAGTISGIVS